MTDIEQLEQLKYLTRMTGALHDAQVQQLKMWPLLVTHALESQAIFDYEGSAIIFNLLKTEENPPENLEERFKLLAQYTRFLLGDEYTVVVKHEGKQVFRETGCDNDYKFKKLRDDP